MSTPIFQKTLSNFANGLFNEDSMENSMFLAPVVPTGQVTFSVNDYAERSGFQTPSAARAIGGMSKAVQSDGGTVEISLKPNGLHDFIDDHELDQAGSAGLALLRQSRTQNLVSQASNSRFKSTIDVINAGTGAGTATVWGASDDPIAELDLIIEEMSNETGLLANKMMMSLTAWRIFRNNPAVIERFPGMNKVSVSTAETEGFFINPSMQIKVCSTVFDSRINVTTSKGNAIGADLYLYYSQDGANLYDNSFAKTFRVRNGVEASVRTSRKDHGEKIMVDWTEVVYVNNLAAGKRLAISES
jgi:hypothetical protein